MKNITLKKLIEVESKQLEIAKASLEAALLLLDGKKEKLSTVEQFKVLSAMKKVQADIFEALIIISPLVGIAEFEK